ncbi:neuronal acetylcholine receptor subunit alpha-7-like [Symsagittifera roscoffensis]|uniref:neuronal acetylcholine receptor subunit alpha-7-like n=1 Tax=Symsagittifera roscoffensis TaxID=84072 RepID=UPI00307C1970
MQSLIFGHLLFSLIITTIILININVGNEETIDSNCNEGEIRFTLGQKLREKYSLLNQPAIDPDDPVVIYYDVALRQLFRVDEKHQVLSLLLWERSSWIDPNLKWDPLDFCNITEIRMKETEVWVPDIVITNSVAEFTRPLDTMIPLQVRHTGEVKWNSPSMRHVSCPIRVKFFPYDRQKCKLDLVSWTYTSDKLRLTTKTQAGFDLSSTHDSGEWSVKNTTFKESLVYYEKSNASHYHLQFRIVIERRPLYYLFYLFVPSSLIMVLSLMTFLLPAESGEKATLAVMVLLSLLILMVSVSEKLPANSKDMPLLSIYFVANMLTVSISMVFSVAIINMHFHAREMGSNPDRTKSDSQSMSSRVKHVAFDKLAPHLGIDASTVANQKDSLTTAFGIHNRPENTLGPALAIHSRVRSSSLRNSLQPRTQFSPKIAQIKEDPIEVIIDKLAVIEHCSLYMASTIHTSYKRDEKKMQWIFIAKIVDRLLLIVFLIVFLLTSAMILAFEFYNDYSS